MSTDTHLAVIGMAGRFPGAANLDQYWTNLAEGVECLRRFTDEELRATGETEIRMADPGYVPVQGVLDEATCFDAELFGYSPREAMLIDPQHRVFLECAWHALEDAGHDPRTYPGRIGVYAGCSPSAYAHRIWQDGLTQQSSLDDYQVSVATAPDHLTTRVSYKLGLTGPSVTVMTTCSTSLVAIHMAAQALLGGECDLAIAGGASVDVPARGYLYREGGTLSPDGHVRTFDVSAAGMVGADGVGAVVLSRLDEARAGGDRVRAVLRGSAVGNLGAERAGYMAPSVAGQADVVRTALRLAEVPAETIGYVEAHGTGTPVGDPIELAALGRVFREDTDRAGFCAIGSVKTNIGHADAAAGVAGFIKVVLALEHRQLPPSLNYQRPNPEIEPEIDMATGPFRVNTALRDWHGDGTPLRAGVSSFGLGGTNAHAVLEEAPPRPPAAPGLDRHLLVVSAGSEQALRTRSADLAGHLRRGADPLDDIAHTLRVGRQALPYRRYVVCGSQTEAADALDRHRPVTPVHGRPVVFLFPGQGSQHPGMARVLHDRLPVFRAEVDRCVELLAPHLDVDLATLLLDPAANADLLRRTDIAQPALFTVEYALARTLITWGVEPAAMVGHSIGELVAACLAGVFDLKDGLALAAGRGRLMAALPTGAMLAVPLPESEVLPLLGGELSVAAVNAPDRVVVSGPHDAVDELAGRLTARSVSTALLRTSHAFHSPVMAPAARGFAELMSRVDRHAPSIPFAGNVTGALVTDEQVTDPGYWAAQLLSPVRFHEGVTSVTHDDPLLIEVGPGQSLTALVRRQRPGAAVVPTLSRPSRREDELATLLTAVGEVWAAGNRIDWPKVHGGAPRRRVGLPLYPFARIEHVLPSLRRRPPTSVIEPTVIGRSEPDRPEPTRPVGDRIATLFGDVLGIPDVAGDADFFDLGGDSLTATQLIARTRDAFAVAVPLDCVFDHPTPAAFSAAVHTLLAEQNGEPR